MLVQPIKLAIGSVFLVKPHVDNGNLRALAVTTSKRSAELPNVPTIAELGYPGFDAPAWWGVIAPAKLSADLTKRMSDEINKALKTPSVAKKLAEQGIDVIGGTPEVFRNFVDKQIDIWGRVVKENGITSGG